MHQSSSHQSTLMIASTPSPCDSDVIYNQIFNLLPRRPNLVSVYLKHNALHIRYEIHIDFSSTSNISPPLGRQALIRRAASALKYIVYNNYAVPNGIRSSSCLVDREKYQTNIDRQMLHKWYLFKYTQKEDHAVRLLSIGTIDTSCTQPISAI